MHQIRTFPMLPYHLQLSPTPQNFFIVRYKCFIEHDNASPALFEPSKMLNQHRIVACAINEFWEIPGLAARCPLLTGPREELSWRGEGHKIVLYGSSLVSVRACACSMIDKIHPQTTWDHQDGSGIESECPLAAHGFAKKKNTSINPQKKTCLYRTRYFWGSFRLLFAKFP